MKKNKSLVVTSLLFSTMILNPSVIQGVIVQADANNQAQVAEVNEAETKMVTFHLSVKDINGKTEIKDYQVKTKLDQKTVTVAEINEALHGFYKLAETEATKAYDVDFTKNEIKDTLLAVDSFVPKTTKTLSVKYLDSTNNGHKFTNTTMVVDKNTTEVASEKIPLPRGYEISGRRMIKIKNDHLLLVHVKPINVYVGHEVSKSDVKVKYVNDKNAKDKIADGVIKDVRDDATSVDPKLVTVPKGYKLVEGQKFAVSYGKVTVHLVPDNTKEITIHYLDSTNNQNKIKDGTMIVEKNVSKIAGETVPMPEGYEISGRRLIRIKHGQILVHVKPVNAYGNHEVSKSDVKVKYVNDKNAKDKIADGVIKDVRDDATSVDPKLVTVPKGYKLVEGQKFAVSYGKVTVHLVPDNTKEITIHYLDSTNNQNKIKDGTMIVEKNVSKIAGETVPMPEGYEISGRRLIRIKHGQILVHVKPVNVYGNHEVSKSDVKVKYVNDKNAKDKIADGVIKDVRDDATSVDPKSVTVPKGYKLVEGQKFAVSYGKVTVHLVPDNTKEITIHYLDSTNNQNKIKDGTMRVANHASIVAHETVPMPEGYEISGRRLIRIKDDQILVHVKPVNAYGNHEVSKSDVRVKYVNDKDVKDKIANGVIKDVRDDATSVDPKLVTVPKGYKLVEGQKFAVSYGKVTVHVVPDETPKPSKPSSSNSSAATQASFRMSVHFVDHKSGDKVYSTELISKEGQKHEVEVPKNYVLAKGETNKISASKKKLTVSIKVVKKATEGMVTEHKATLAVVNNAPLYSVEGEVVNDRALAKNSNWFTDKTLVLAGTTYYRVSTNEWVKASDVYEFTAVNKTIQTSAKTAKALYDTKGNVIGDRALAASSSWHSDRLATINGKQMYRVATNEWVLASDLI